jgi:hypothetical protein
MFIINNSQIWTPFVTNATTLVIASIMLLQFVLVSLPVALPITNFVYAPIFRGNSTQVIISQSTNIFPQSTLAEGLLP